MTNRSFIFPLEKDEQVPQKKFFLLLDELIEPRRGPEKVGGGKGVPGKGETDIKVTYGQITEIKNMGGNPFS